MWECVVWNWELKKEHGSKVALTKEEVLVFFPEKKKIVLGLNWKVKNKDMMLKLWGLIMVDFLFFIFKKKAFIYSIFGVLLSVLPEIHKRSRNSNTVC